MSAPALFREFLSCHGLAQSAAAEQLGVSPAAVHHWLSGAKRPRAAHREAIARWTGGAVPALAWALSGEREAVARIRPFRPRTRRRPAA